MRPFGPARGELVQALGSGPATSRVLAQRTGLCLGEVQRTLGNMQRPPRVAVVVLECTRVEGVSRPVPVYALPLAGAADRPVDALLDAPRVDAIDAIDAIDPTDTTAALAHHMVMHFWGDDSG